MGTWQHRLSNINVKEFRADCSSCGDIKVYKKKNNKKEYYICSKKALSDKRKRYIPKPKKSKEKKIPSPKHGLSREEVIKLKIGKQCFACTESQESLLRVDHEHSSGLIRGILCNNCNVALGLLKDDPIRLQNLIEYIRNPPLIIN